MSVVQGSEVLKEVETAIEKRNFGRMNEIGGEILIMAKDAPEWIDAINTISGYLAKNEDHRWDALHLSKQAAVIAPENSAIQGEAVKVLTATIKAFPKVEDRVRAAHAVVIYCPKNSSVLVISINIMLDNVLGLPHAKDRRRFTLVALQYAPENSAVMLKAKTFLQREDVLLAKTANANVKAPEKKEDGKTLLNAFENRRQVTLPPKKGTGPQTEPQDVRKEILGDKVNEKKE